MSCICQDCGKGYTVDLIIPDEQWEEIKPSGKPKGGGLLCPSCILEKMADMKGYVKFDLTASKISGKGKINIIEELETLLEDNCEVCGDVDGPQWKECGCHTQGVNEGIKKAIAILEEKDNEST